MTMNLLQIGIYSVPDASRLTGVSSWRIRRLLKGYEFKVKQGRHRSPAIWNNQIDPIDHAKHAKQNCRKGTEKPQRIEPLMNADPR